MKRTAAALVVAVGIVGIVIAREGHAPSAQAAVKNALARTVDARTSRFTITVTMHDEEDFAIHGLMDYIHHRGRIDFGSSEVVFDGRYTYMKWPVSWRNDASWLRYESDQEDANTDLLDLQHRLLNDPMGLLRFLVGASDGMRVAGSEDVRGTPTTHYEGILDLQRVVDQAPPDKRAELQEWLDLMREDEPTTASFGVWVDRDGVARRLRIDEGDGGSIVIEYYDFGIPVEITTPPRDQMMTIEEFMKDMEQHMADSGCGEPDASPDDSSADGGGIYLCEDSTAEGDGGALGAGAEGP